MLYESPRPPTLKTVQDLGYSVLQNLPAPLAAYKSASLELVDFPEEKYVEKFGLDSPYELLALYDAGVLHLYRRPILDVWCESGRALQELLFEIIVSELGQAAQLSDEEIAALCEQGL